MNLLKHSLKYFHSSIIRHNLVSNNIHQKLIYSNIPIINPFINPQSTNYINIINKVNDEEITSIDFKGRNTRSPRRVNI